MTAPLIHDAPLRRPPKDAPLLLSLFAGAGGLDVGLEEAGFVTVAANEMQPYACETLRSNRLLPTLGKRAFDDWFHLQVGQRCYKRATELEIAALRNRIEPRRKGRAFLSCAQILEGDVRTFSSKQIAEASGVKRGQLALVAGGPPCQPFSRAGKRETLDVADGRLFLEFVRIVKDLRPRWFLFENVKGLLLSKTSVVRRACSNCDRSEIAPFDQRHGFLAGVIGTTSECSECHQPAPLVAEDKRGGSLDIIASEFARIGYTPHIAVLNAADFGAPQLRERVIILGSRDNESLHWPTPTHAQRSDGPSQMPLFGARGRTGSWRTMIDALYSEGHPVYGPLDPKSAVLWVKNVVRPHDEPVTWKLDRPSPTIGAHQAAKLAIAPLGVPEEQLRRQQWHTLGRRQGDLPPVPVIHEYLSDEELLALQTFPRDWFLYGTRMQRAFQIGNAVPVALARALGHTLLGASQAASHDTQEDRKHVSHAARVQQA